MTATVFPKTLKNDLDIILCSAFLSGHYINLWNISPNSKIILQNIIKPFEHITLNLYPKSVKGKFSLNFIKHSKSF